MCHAAAVWPTPWASTPAVVCRTTARLRDRGSTTSSTHDGCQSPQRPRTKPRCDRLGWRLLVPRRTGARAAETRRLAWRFRNLHWCVTLSAHKLLRLRTADCTRVRRVSPSLRPARSIGAATVLLAERCEVGAHRGVAGGRAADAASCGQLSSTPPSQRRRTRRARCAATAERRW